MVLAESVHASERISNGSEQNVEQHADADFADAPKEHPSACRRRGVDQTGDAEQSRGNPDQASRAKGGAQITGLEHQRVDSKLWRDRTSNGRPYEGMSLARA